MIRALGFRQSYVGIEGYICVYKVENSVRGNILCAKVVNWITFSDPIGSQGTKVKDTFVLWCLRDFCDTLIERSLKLITFHEEYIFCHSNKECFHDGPIDYDATNIPHLGSSILDFENVVEY